MMIEMVHILKDVEKASMSSINNSITATIGVVQTVLTNFAFLLNL